jgi:hypothetical protein
MPTSRVLWLVAFAIGWMMTGYDGIAIGQVVGVDDPSDMADSSGDIKRIEAWVDEGDLNLTMTVYGVFAPSVADTPAGMTNRYYYHWLLDTDNNPATGYLNNEYEGNSTHLQTPIGVDVLVQFGWRNGDTDGVYAYTLDPLTGDEVELFEDYEYTIDGDTIHAVIPLADLGLTSDDTIAVSAFQEGASNGWQCDWVESVVLPLTVVRAFNPIPATDSNDIVCDVILGWSAGRHAATHDVYLGTVFNDVNDASRTDPRGVLVSEGQADATFDPEALLDFDTTYYWRIDEVSAAPDNTIHKGQVWRFTTEPYAYPITGLMATASSEQPTSPAIRTIDGSGLNDLDQHSTEATQMWMSAGTKPNWIQFEFDKVYKLHELQVWNSNQVIEAFMGFGAKSVTIETSADGTTWMPVSDVPEFSQAPGAPGYAANTTVSLGGTDAKFVKLTIDTNWGGVAPQTGLAEVQFSYVPVQAREPQPTDAAADVGVDTSLNWRPGREVASHEVFFGTDRAAVADGTVGAKTVTAHDSTPGSLNFGTTYYWKVDEVGAATYPGDVWSFTTQEYQAIDDFESYTDKAGKEIFSAWIDGFTTGLSGSTVGYLTATNGTFGETTIVHAGRQSMPLAYDNTKAPFVSEAERTFDTAQNWTTNGADSLVVHFRGLDPASPTQPEGNSAEGLYFVVKDTSGKTKVVQHPDPAATNATSWQAWTIPLSDFTSAGVKMNAIKSLTIGVGNKAAPKAGGTGTMYFDDIGFGHPTQ